jgi:3-phenylpropionate/trans-cinnamate dioxygenase ferredoxin component
MAKPGAKNITYYPVAESAELTEGGRLHLDADGKPILLLRVEGIVYAVAATCTHEEETLANGLMDGHELICPYHGARYDVRNGEAVALPAVMGIAVYPVREADGQIEIGFAAD